MTSWNRFMNLATTLDSVSESASSSLSPCSFASDVTVALGCRLSVEAFLFTLFKDFPSDDLMDFHRLTRFLVVSVLLLVGRLASRLERSSLDWSSESNTNDGLRPLYWERSSRMTLPSFASWSTSASVRIDRWSVSSTSYSISPTVEEMDERGESSNAADEALSNARRLACCILEPVCAMECE